VLKFWLNVSKDEQRKRFLDRIEEPEANWKFSPRDVDERKRWNDYMSAYQETLNATSRKFAPWYAIPADNKPFMRRTVSEIIVQTLEGLDIDYPPVSQAERQELLVHRADLKGETPG
jgi:polyphosphate kinase 2 (PPK2 family)